LSAWEREGPGQARLYFYGDGTYSALIDNKSSGGYYDFTEGQVSLISIERDNLWGAAQASESRWSTAFEGAGLVITDATGHRNVYAPGTAEPLRKEAEQQASQFWARSLSKCGDSLVARYEFPPNFLNEWTTTDLKNPSFTLVGVPVNEADRLNTTLLPS
jgi:hypothetical protein